MHAVRNRVIMVLVNTTTVPKLSGLLHPKILLCGALLIATTPNTQPQHWTPASISSDQYESSPSFTPDGRLLFGSSREGGLGKSDIYMASLEAGRWHVVNVGAPVNTPANEYEAELSRDGKTLVVVTDRVERSHLYIYKSGAAGWQQTGQVPARADVFQVGPSLSPTGDRLLFAQADGDRSGEIFLFELEPHSDAGWPPDCQ